ncbi:MAG: DUF4389 domain-containing protein [Saprospirales bacterium]|nr:MAG: DUF4389 domain-containing protein [Saprospirales bacterium]
MKINIIHQEEYSRFELLLRSFLGFLYIALPHGFILFFLFIWSSILQFLTFWIVLFAGRFPESFFEYQLKLKRWNFRVNARLYHLSDDYPAFGLNAQDDHIEYEVPYLENPSRSLVLLRGLLGWLYVWIPHGFVLFFLSIAASIVTFIAWFVVLFTGKYPFDLFRFVNNFLKYNERVGLYMSYMVDVYPPFSLSAEGYEEEVARRAGVMEGDSDDRKNDFKETDLV